MELWNLRLRLLVVLLGLNLTLALAGEFHLFTPLRGDQWGFSYTHGRTSWVIVPANAKGITLIALPGLKRYYQPAEEAPVDAVGCFMNLAGKP